MKEIPATGRVMIVDDTPQNLLFLETILRTQGHRVLALPGGEMALKAAAREHPEVILLDILMPGMDGYEVCLRLKANPELAEIPVIFLSALSEPVDKVRAFEVGGVDYVTKPFHPEEVEARVRTHLELVRQRQALRASYQRLQELERLRDNLVHMMVHDMRSPLSVVGLSLEMVKDVLPEADPNLRELVGAGVRSVGLMNKMIGLLLDISRMEEGQMPVRKVRGDLLVTAEAAIEGMRLVAGARRLAVTGNGPAECDFDPDLIGRVLENLLGNAFKFTAETGEVRVEVTRIRDDFRVAVRDDGPGIPAEFHGVIFEKFGQVQSRKRRLGTGLGLAFCKLALEAHGGRIGVESAPGRGSEFWFTIPAAG